MTPVEKVIDAALAPFIKSDKRRAEAAAAMEEALTEEGHLLEDVSTVEVLGSRVAVETVSEFGLDISLDSGRNAVRVSSPYGFEVIE